MAFEWSTPTAPVFDMEPIIRFTATKTGVNGVLTFASTIEQLSNDSSPTEAELLGLVEALYSGLTGDGWSVSISQSADSTRFLQVI